MEQPPRAVGPLSEATFFILLSLSTSDKHGYAIMRDVQQISDERVVLTTGTLYGALKRLLEAGWIERIAQPRQSRDLKHYRLTATGRAVLKHEAERLHSLIRAIERYHGGLTT